MHPVREFRGKNVDEAILLACQAFGVEREELEIDIVSMGSPGIFGFGAKKAVIMARRRAPLLLDPLLEEAEDTPPQEEADLQEEDVADATLDDEEDDEETASPRSDQKPVDMERLHSLTHQLLAPILTAMCGHMPSIAVHQDRDGIVVRIEDEAHHGLIIGREGQTILALQYVFNRILAKAWPEAPRVQLDAGDFRARQIQRLQALAQSLAVRAKRSGRIQSTGLLSSFHRRMVHMALRSDNDVRTISKGSGPLKRVLICPTKARRRTP